MGMWNVFTKPYQNITRIFPTQQADVGRMIDVCKDDPNIQKIIIFAVASCRFAIRGVTSTFILR